MVQSVLMQIKHQSGSILSHGAFLQLHSGALLSHGIQLIFHLTQLKLIIERTQTGPNSTTPSADGCKHIMVYIIAHVCAYRIVGI